MDLLAFWQCVEVDILENIPMSEHLDSLDEVSQHFFKCTVKLVRE